MQYSLQLLVFLAPFHFVLTSLHQPLVHRCFVNELFHQRLVRQCLRSVIVKNNSQNLLSADSWPSVGRQLAVCQPTVGRQSAVCWPTVGQQSADCWPTVGRQTADRLLTAEYGSHCSLLPLGRFANVLSRFANDLLVNSPPSDIQY